MLDVPAPIQDHEIGHLHSLYGYLMIPPLTSQQEVGVLTWIKSGMLHLSATQCGMKEENFKRLINKPHVAKLICMIRFQTQEKEEITREDITGMLLESYHKAETVTEEINAAKELGKLHDVYKSDHANREKRVEVDHTIKVRSEKDVQKLTDEELLKLAGSDPIDADFEELPMEGVPDEVADG